MLQLKHLLQRKKTNIDYYKKSVTVKNVKTLKFKSKTSKVTFVRHWKKTIQFLYAGICSEYHKCFFLFSYAFF